MEDSDAAHGPKLFAPETVRLRTTYVHLDDVARSGEFSASVGTPQLPGVDPHLVRAQADLPGHARVVARDQGKPPLPGPLFLLGGIRCRRVAVAGSEVLVDDPKAPVEHRLMQGPSGSLDRGPGNHHVPLVIDDAR